MPTISTRSEAARLAALHRYRILDTPPDPTLDRLTRMAARLFDVPSACVALVDEGRIWIKSGHGLDEHELRREPGLCETTLDVEGVHHVPDAARDPAVASNSIVAGGVRFYAGAALRTPEGHGLGTFCLLGYEPRDMSADEKRLLQELAGLAMDELERHRASVDLVHAGERSRLALHDSEERFRAIFEQAAVGIAQVGLDGRWLRVNRKVCEIVGYDEAELVRLTFQAITHPDDLETNLVDLRRALAGEIDTYGLEKRYIRKDGSTVWINLTVSLVRDPSGQPKYFISVIQDVGERKRAEEALRKAEERLRQVQKLESLGVLAGGVAHDFNNLLVGVLGNAGLLLGELPEGSALHERVRMIEEAAERAAELTDQMLACSGKGSFLVGPIDLNELIGEMRGLLGMGLAANVVAEHHLAPEPVRIEGDGTQMRQVLMNLVSNAAEAIGDQPGTISISTGVLDAGREYLASTYVDDQLPAGPYAYFDVTDTGCGMDRETLGRIFEPFFTTKFTGRGLGLAAVLGIVRGHKGAIAIDTRPGGGARFRLLFPRAAPPAAGDGAPAAARGAAGWRGSGMVLVVEDEPLVRSLACDVLERAGFRPLAAGDGAEGVRLFREHAAEIVAVLLDVTLPRMSGEAALRAMRAIRPDTPVVCSSGYNQHTLAEHVRDQRSLRFLKKPYSSGALLDAFRTALA